jgi:hypothetical protein
VAEHTPGPWEAAGLTIYEGNGKHSDICELFSRLEHTVQISEAEAVANAHLIAAAPDYFAAVDYWIEQIYDGEPLKDWQQQLLAAHRKAKGEGGR